MRRPEPAAGLAVLAALAALATPAAAADPEPQKKLETIERALGAERETQQRLAREAEALARELRALRTRSVALAAALQDGEEQLSALERELARLDADATAKEEALERRRAELARLVAQLARFGRQPPEAALVLPATPLETVRAARLLGAATPALRRHAAALAQDLAAVQAAREDVAAHRLAVADAAVRLTQDRAALGALIERRVSLQQDTEAAQRGSAGRLQRLSREAQSIRELIERLAAEQAAREAAAREAERQREEAAAAARLAVPPPPVASPEPPRGRTFAEHGQLVPPARGRIVLSFGQAGEGGQPHRGLTIETRPGGQIVAPYDGQIAFAGPFRAYGLILIIEHAEGYHTLLAGLGRIDGAVGQTVTAGEPVGAAGSPEQGNPSIYVELRRNGQPINPGPWLASRNEKVSG